MKQSIYGGSHFFLKLAVISLGFLSSVNAAQFLDGVWNGKPWDKDKLTSGVKNGDNDALAEWIMCSQTGELEIAYDAQLVFSRSEKLAKQNHPLGITCYAQCYLWGKGARVDQPRGIKLLEKGVKLGHPHAKWWLGKLMREGDGGVKMDKAKGIKLIKAAERSGDVYALLTRAWMAQEGDSVVLDLEASAGYLIKFFEEHNNYWATAELYRAYRAGMNHRFAGMKKYIPDELFEAVNKRLRECAELHIPYIEYLMGSNEMSKGNPHLAIPLMIRSARGGTAAAHITVYYWTRREYYQNQNKVRYVDANKLVASQAARLFYESGHKGSDRVLLRFIGDLMDEKKYTPKQKQDIPIILHRISRKKQNGEGKPHHFLGMFYGDKGNAKKGGDKAAYLRGLAHLRYECNCCPYGASRLGFMQAYAEGPFYNAPEAICSLELVCKKWKCGEGSHPWKVKEKLLEKMTAQQLKKYEELKLDGYPADEKYRKKAFLYLQKIGDLPAHWIYEPKRDESENDEDIDL